MIQRDERRLILFWEKLMGMEGEEIVVTLLPFQQSLLIRVVRYILMHPEEYIDDYDADNADMVADIIDAIDDITHRLSAD